MVKLNKIYTRTGDKGTTGLVDGSRVSKSAPIITAIGDVDEANSAIGVARVALEADPFEAVLGRIQNDLFDLGADIATPDTIEGALRITQPQIDWLEEQIDALNEDLAPLTSFVLPAGTAAAAAIHLSRAITRRAERATVAVAPGSLPATYLNRLSDLLFVATRAVNQKAGGDVLWVPGGAR